MRRLQVAAATALLMGLVVGCSADDDTTVTDSVSGSEVDSSIAVVDSAGDMNAGDRLDRAAEALGDADFGTVFDALSLSSIGDEIEDRAVTLLAPTNDAFGELSADELTDIMSDPTEIDDLLRRHVLDEALSLDELSTRTEVTTIGGDTLPVTADGTTVTVDGATVTEVDNVDQGTPDSDFVVLALDAVLLPDG